MRTFVEKEACEACGQDVREGSAFCYNCGESVEPEPVPPAIIRPDPGLLTGKPSRDEDGGLSEPELPPVTIPAGRLDPVPEASAAKERFPAAKTHIDRPRARVVKTREVEWVEPATGSGAFITTAIILTIVAALLTAAALYIH